MKFEINTVSMPVVGREAEKLSKAIEAGGHVANERALETMQRIAQRRNRQLVTNANG